MKYDPPTLSDGTPVDSSQLCFIDDRFPMNHGLLVSLAIAWEAARKLVNFGCAMASHGKIVALVDGAKNEEEVSKQIRAQFDARYGKHRRRPEKSVVTVTTYRPAGTLTTYASMGTRVLFPFETEPGEDTLKDWWLGLYGDKPRALVLYPYTIIEPGSPTPKRGPR